MFPDGEFLYATIKDAAQCINCLPIQPKNMVNIKCDSSIFDEGPEHIIPDEEKNDGPYALLMHLSVYTYQGICATHGIIKNVTILCRICEDNDDIKNGLIKSPTYIKKKHL